MAQDGLRGQPFHREVRADDDLHRLRQIVHHHRSVVDTFHVVQCLLSTRLVIALLAVLRAGSQ